MLPIQVDGMDVAAVQLIKIDVEGMELDVLKGSIRQPATAIVGHVAQLVSHSKLRWVWWLFYTALDRQ